MVMFLDIIYHRYELLELIYNKKKNIYIYIANHMCMTTHSAFEKIVLDMYRSTEIRNQHYLSKNNIGQETIHVSTQN